MKAIAYHRCGTPDVLELEEIPKPTPAPHQVLIRIRAAGVNPLDRGEIKGVPAVFRYIFGVRGPDARHPGHPGVDIAGVVEAIGASVTQFKPGDEVFGVCLDNPENPGLNVWTHRQGAFAEYAAVPEAGLVHKPANISFEKAASAPIAALTALQGLRDKGRIQPGQKVLVHGAGGGVGTFAVQIAKAFGAEVTAVTCAANLDLMRSLGADSTIDYGVQDFTRTGLRYDLIFDCHTIHSLADCRRALAPRGIYVTIGGSPKAGAIGILAGLVQMNLSSRFGSRKFFTLLARPRKEDLNTLRELMEAGRVTPVIGCCYGLKEVPQAIELLERGGVCGKVVVAVQ